MRIFILILITLIIGCSEGPSVTNHTRQNLVDLPASLSQQDAIVLAEKAGKEVYAEAADYFATYHGEIPAQALNHLTVRWGQSISHSKGTHQTYIKVIAVAESPIAEDSTLASALDALTAFTEAKAQSVVEAYNKSKQAGTP